MPERWHNAPGTQSISESKDLDRWWKKFEDPVLDDLISRALAANHDIRIAVTRVREAGALLTMAESVLYPSIDISATGGREKRIDRVIPVSTNRGVELKTRPANAVSAGLAAQWEVDLFGGRRLEAEAAAAQAGRTEEDLRAMQVRILTQVATHYLELRGIQQQTIVLQENIDIQRQRMRLLQAFSRSGLSNEWAVTRQETLLRSTNATLPLLTNRAAVLIHRLGVLLGEQPTTLQNRLGQPALLSKAVPKIPKLLPSDLLLQRPDLRLAQTEVTAMAANLGAAKTDLLPKFQLSVSAGFGALALSGFPSIADSVYTLGSGLSAPLFNSGRIRAQIAAADARLEQAAAQYEKTFLIAMEDVENAFVAHTSALERRDQLILAEAAAERSNRQAMLFYQHGVTDFLSVLDAMQTKLSINDGRVKSETAVLVSLVSLYQAFGGGWTD